VFDDIFGRPTPPPGPTLVTFVCMGNICRSPLAEKVLRARLRERGFGDVEITSAGLQAVVGSGMDELPKAIAERAGADSAHVAKPVSAELLRASSLILTMTREQRAEIAQEYPFALKRTFTLVEFTRILTELEGDVPRPSRSAGRTLFDAVVDASRFRGMIALTEVDDIEDPYRRSAETHERVGSRVTQLADHLAEQIAGS
jgi:protein-tyrosine phosphatase